MKNLTSIIIGIEKRCKREGIRLTDKRKQILQGLIQSEKALSAYEIIEGYNGEHYKKILPMSAYRILEFLEDQCLIHKLPSVNKYVVCAYLHNGTSHKHHEISQFLICKICSKVEEMAINKLAQTHLLTNIQQCGFSLVSPQIEISCICSKCKLNVV